MLAKVTAFGTSRPESIPSGYLVLSCCLLAIIVFWELVLVIKG